MIVLGISHDLWISSAAIVINGKVKGLVQQLKGFGFEFPEIQKAISELCGK